MVRYLMFLTHKYEVLNLIMSKERMEKSGIELYDCNPNMVVTEIGR